MALLTQTTDYVGPALSRQLADGHHLVLHALTESLVDELRSLGAQVEVVPAADVDLRTADGNRALVWRALARFGRVDAAAFVTGAGGRFGGMAELTEFAAVLLEGRTRFQTGQFFCYSGGWSA